MLAGPYGSIRSYAQVDAMAAATLRPEWSKPFYRLAQVRQ